MNRPLLFILSAVVVNFAASAFVLFGFKSHLLTLLWIGSLGLWWLAYTKKTAASSLPRPSVSRVLLVIAAICLPVLVRIAHFSADRLHDDAFITSYYSGTENFLGKSFFSEIPDNKDWITEFPRLYFALQRIFFDLFGRSVTTINLSVQPYVLLLSAALFFSVRRLFGERTALLTLLLYSFFSFSVYLERQGLHFVSSTSLLMALFYLMVRCLQDRRRSDFALAGIVCGLCYLFYISSYIALPLFALFLAGYYVKFRHTASWKEPAIGLGGFILVLLPFFAWALHTGTAYMRRINQVGLLNGEWSPAREAIEHGESAWTIVWNNTWLCLKSLVLDDVGGHGGYNFGYLSFFEPVGLGLFAIGLVAGLFLLRQKPILAISYLIVIGSFASGMALTIAPPAFHRWSGALPFIALFMALPMELLWKIPRIPQAARYGIVAVLILAFLISNERHVRRAIERDPVAGDLALGEYLNREFPGYHVHMAAYPGFAFEKIYYFVPHRSTADINTDYHGNYLSNFDRRTPYVYIIHAPKDGPPQDPTFEDRFIHQDPLAKLVPFSNKYSLLIRGNSPAAAENKTRP